MEKFKQEHFTNQEFKKLLDSCLISRNTQAPAWKREIDNQVAVFSS